MNMNKLWVIHLIIPVILCTGNATPFLHNFDSEDNSLASPCTIQPARLSALNTPMLFAEFSSPSPANIRHLSSNGMDENSDRAGNGLRTQTPGDWLDDIAHYWYLVMICLVGLLAAIFFIFIDYLYPYFCFRFSR